MTLYRRLIEGWERRLTLKDRNRRIFPFSWGEEWIPPNPLSGSDPLSQILKWAAESTANSSEFFFCPPIEDCESTTETLTFSTPTPGPHLNNNRVRVRLFPADSSKAVILVPQWNADEGSHVGLCRLLQRMGYTVARMTLPFHEERRPPGMLRADFMVSPNVGRTLHATRQAVLEVRQVAGWLQQQGFDRIAAVGTSIGSCVSYLAFVHEPRICTGVFNHVSSSFADVVWSGLSTRYVRWGLEGLIKLDDLRECWAPISPNRYVDRLVDDPRPHLMITARYDLTFLPELSEQVFEHYQKCGARCEKVTLPCGHYTMAKSPFKYLDGWHISRFLRKNL